VSCFGRFPYKQAAAWDKKPGEQIRRVPPYARFDFVKDEVNEDCIETGRERVTFREHARLARQKVDVPVSSKPSFGPLDPEPVPVVTGYPSAA
jgi:hypothetical protein